MVTFVALFLSSEPHTAPELQALRAVCISNDIYGNYMMPSFDFAKGFTQPFTTGSICSMSDDINDAHNRLQPIGS